jgi:hypothetical protein
MKTANDVIKEISLAATEAQIADIMIEWLEAFSQQTESLYREGFKDHEST